MLCCKLPATLWSPHVYVFRLVPISLSMLCKVLKKKVIENHLVLHIMQ